MPTSASSPSYEPVPSLEGQDHDVEHDGPTLESTHLQQHTRRFDPLQVEQEEEEDGLVVSISDDTTNVPLCSLRDPWLVSVGITLILIVPTLCKATFMTNDLTGRMWPTTLFSLHMALASWTAYCLVPNKNKRKSRVLVIFSFLLDVLLFGTFYPVTCRATVDNLFTEPDGTTVIEWSDVARDLRVLRILALLIALLRICILGLAFVIALVSRRATRTATTNPQQQAPPRWRVPRMCTTAMTRLEHWDESISSSNKNRFKTMLRAIFGVVTVFALALVVWCVVSLVGHFGTWSAPSTDAEGCDPLDITECCLPFPSFHHMVPDETTVTGWRVNLRSNVLPPLKGRRDSHIDPSFLNELDGFSTMAPMLFYLEGLKEAQLSGKSNTVRLQGYSNLALSVTNQSITLLLDVDAKQLVHHSAEIDYLDPDRPLVMVFPAQPLKHNTHYALAVVNAADVHGELLDPTPGMTALFALKTNGTGSSNLAATIRLGLYQNLVLPSLVTAAPWLTLDDEPKSLQLLFDFQTVSAESQLGSVRAVRDATMRHIESPAWDWKEHARVVRKFDGDCRRNGVLTARTIHAELDVPWFLQGYGPGHRGDVLDDEAVQWGIAKRLGKAKFVIYVPCSIRAAALNETSGMPLKAFVEFGHGLFGTRMESSEHFLQKMNNDKGYIMTAMDWRGMSAFDMLIVVKTLMATPRLFQAVRDNLIQGYANKYAMQHFVRHALLEMDWMTFSSRRQKQIPIPLANATTPSVFYGISQGGILGAGYTALSGTTGLIDRGALGVPGTPFALVMTRSHEFKEYDSLLLLNFFNNRHVRVLLSLVQMGWDSVEGSGVLSRPLTEPYPPLLLQAGLGDAVVSTIAAEALSRALNASILPGNPRQDIFGIPVKAPANETWPGPRVTLTEMLYEDEYASLPKQDILNASNWVHLCTRRDTAMITQVEEFIDTGRVMDPCELDGCIRSHASYCFATRR